MRLKHGAAAVNDMGSQRERTRRTAMRQYVQILAGKAEVSGVDLGAAATPLVR